MGAPIGNTAYAYRLRPALQKNRICICADVPTGAAGFRENVEKTGNVNFL